MARLRSVVGKILFLLAVLSVALVGWRWGPFIVASVREWAGLVQGPELEEAAPSAALADSVLAQVQEFRQGEGGQMALEGREVTSVLRYSLPGLIPSGVEDLRVAFEDGRVRLSAEVVLASFPELPDLGPVLGILPDTLDVVVRASLVPFGEEESALLVHGVEASRIPIPRRLIPEILRAVGRVDRPGLPPEALAVPLPAGVRSAYILTDSLIISSPP
ncbi:MAG: hypothetical protein ACWGSQ_13065 [Longimicrobiales bacterium]